MLKNLLIVYICNSSQSKRYALTIFALAFLLLIAFVTNRQLNKKIQSYKKQISELLIQKQKLDCSEISTQISTLQGQLKSGLLKKDVNNDRLFLNLARNANLNVDSYLPEEFNNPNYCKTKYKISLSGDFKNVYNFFNQLAEVKTTLKCCSIKLTNQDGLINLESIYNCYLSNEAPN